MERRDSGTLRDTKSRLPEAALDDTGQMFELAALDPQGSVERCETFLDLGRRDNFGCEFVADLIETDALILQWASSAKSCSW